MGGVKIWSHVNKHKDQNMVKMLFMVSITPKNKSKQLNSKSERRGTVKMLHKQLDSIHMNFIYKVTVKFKIVCAGPPNKRMTGNAGGQGGGGC